MHLYLCLSSQSIEIDNKLKGVLLAPGLVNIRADSQRASQPTPLTRFSIKRISTNKKLQLRKVQMEDSLVAPSSGSTSWAIAQLREAVPPKKVEFMKYFCKRFMIF